LAAGSTLGYPAVLQDEDFIDGRHAGQPVRHKQDATSVSRSAPGQRALSPRRTMS
jgi:hypothetical protein